MAAITWRAPPFICIATNTGYTNAFINLNSAFVVARTHNYRNPIRIATIGFTVDSGPVYTCRLIINGIITYSFSFTGTGFNIHTMPINLYLKKGDTYRFSMLSDTVGTSPCFIYMNGSYALIDYRYYFEDVPSYATSSDSAPETYLFSAATGAAWYYADLNNSFIEGVAVAANANITDGVIRIYEDGVLSLTQALPTFWNTERFVKFDRPFWTIQGVRYSIQLESATVDTITQARLFGYRRQLSGIRQFRLINNGRLTGNSNLQNFSYNQQTASLQTNNMIEHLIKPVGLWAARSTVASSTSLGTVFKLSPTAQGYVTGGQQLNITAVSELEVKNNLLNTSGLTDSYIRAGDQYQLRGATAGNGRTFVISLICQEVR